MRETKAANIEIGNIIGSDLGIKFSNNEYDLDGWGDADDYYKFSENDLILLECELGQKHPNTNVLKVFPYLENNPSKRIVMIQYFYPENKAPKNRIALCNYLGLKMEKDFVARFQYVPLRCDVSSISKELREEKKGLIKMFLKSRKNIKHLNSKADLSKSSFSNKKKL